VGREYIVPPASVIFISNLEQHTVEVLGDVYERYTLKISMAAADALLKNHKLLSIFSLRPEGFDHAISVKQIAPRAESLLAEILKEVTANEQYAEDMCLLHIKNFLITLYRLSPDSFPSINDSAVEVVKDVKNYIQNNCSQQLSLTDVCAHYQWSTYYLAHKFKQITGYGIKQYLLLCRLSLASEWLCSTNRPVTDIAMEAGFTDINNFGRYFRREIGCSPTEYRSSSIKKVEE